MKAVLKAMMVLSVVAASVPAFAADNTCPLLQRSNASVTTDKASQLHAEEQKAQQKSGNTSASADGQRSQQNKQ